MSQYQRFVSYLYEYEKNEKKKNCGFVRVEVLHHQCKIELHLNLPSLPFTPSFRAYTFVPTQQKLQGIFLGTPTIRQGNLYGLFSIPDTNIQNTGWNLKDLGGLLISSDTGTIYATSWKDQPIYPDHFLFPESSSFLQAASVDDTSPDSSLPASNPPTEPTDQPTNTKKTEPTFPWQTLETRYPQVHPFFDEEIHHCLQLSPKDIPTLGSFGITGTNNQFFLYGSHAFQHFLLGQMDHDNQTCYLLAVPGIYDEKEQLLAGLFGFHHFKSARAKTTSSGHFGYWYRTIGTAPVPTTHP